jgi:hypothetical protein
VVGVAREFVVLNASSVFSPVGAFYFPVAQVGPGWLVFTIRSTVASPTLAADIRRAIAALDPGLPVYRIQSMDTWIDNALVGRRAPMLLAAGFSGVALLLAAIGIYGVLAYGVAERRRELGVRMALGGSGGSVFRLVLRDGLTIVAAGITLGLIGAALVGQTMQSLLYGVGPMNPVVIGVVTVGLSLVAMVASGIPALRASRISPAVVLAK